MACAYHFIHYCGAGEGVESASLEALKKRLDTFGDSPQKSLGHGYKVTLSWVSHHCPLLTQLGKISGHTLRSTRPQLSAILAKDQL